MTASQQGITPNTPMGANLVPGGATFRVWAPQAREVYVSLPAPGEARDAPFVRQPEKLLVKHGDDHWTGFFPGVGDGTLYRFFVVGNGSSGYKRDPYARELEMGGSGDWRCIVRDPNSYPWHDHGYRPPAFNDLIVYQFHFGQFYAKDGAGRDIRPGRVCKFLDVVDRIEYFADLGVNALMPLPFQEYPTPNSRGYNGSDLFSPEMDYGVGPAELDDYLARVNRLLRAKGQRALERPQLTGQVNQLKAFIDLCHLYGIAVIADVVYNHAGGFGPQDTDQSLYFFDRQAGPDNNNSQYFYGGEGHAGGLVFAFNKDPVRAFLIDNGKSLLQEYHVDGLRYDQVTVIDERGGWFFAQQLTETLRFVKPSALQLAEYWGNANDRWKGVATPPFGMGFDAGYSDSLRQNVRTLLAQVAHGRDSRVDLDAVRGALEMTFKNPGRWTVFQQLENHDLEDVTHDDKQPRIAALSGPADTWYRTSRARVAAGLLMTAPGIPMLFMGQEFLEDKFWSDDPNRRDLLIWWQGFEGLSRRMSDYHRFIRDLLWLRRKQPAFRGEGINVFHVHNDNRVLAFQRWVPGLGRDVIVVMSLNEHTFYDRSYRIGFPSGGHWQEVFNSDVYENFTNPAAQGNYGGVDASGPAWDGLPCSAGITLPANGFLVFARSFGD